jgi:tetratricopeptide (TPR) repeat protein
MKKILIAFFLLSSINSFSQEDSLRIALDSGIAFHDKGEYEKAIRVYDDIIKKDPDYYFAWYEKTYSLYAYKKFNDCISVCEEIFKRFPDNPQNANIYSNWGSALDDMGNSQKAIFAYSKGIKDYPDAYQLYLNKGITEYLHNQIPEATEDFKKAISLNPIHASSHQFLGYCVFKKNKMAAALALSTFLLLEPEGQRAEKNLDLLKGLLASNVARGDGKNVTITLSPSLLETKQKGPDDFHMQEFMISLRSAMDSDEKFKDLDAAQKLQGKLEIFCTKEVQNQSRGFFTQKYIPLLAALQKDSLMETATHLMYSSSNDKKIIQWLDDNKEKVNSLNSWLKAYAWNKE